MVDEAATDVIAAEQARGVDEPWREPLFIDQIVERQRSRQLGASGQSGGPGEAGPDDGVQFFDRSPVCTLALARYLGYSPSAALTAEIERITSREVYQRQVFFVRPLGFIEPSAARRISYQEALKFERMHEVEYGRLGYELVDIPPAEAGARAAMIEAYLAAGC